MTQALDYQPLVLVCTKDQPNDEWLEYRRRGIGGSDASAVLGISPFGTARDLYYEKINVVTANEPENWVALKVGKLLEPLVAEIFEHKTSIKAYERKYMFQHPLYPWMLADLDYLVTLPDGTTAILEIKTTNYNARENWFYNGKEIVPAYYEAQGRHYMAVMNIDRVYYCCLYGNNEREALIRHIDRDMAYESELIALESYFWHENVLVRNPPPFTEDGELIMETLRRQHGLSDKDAPPVQLTSLQFAKVARYLELQQEKKLHDSEAKRIEAEMNRLKALIAAEMGKSCTAVYEDAGENYTISFSSVRKPIIPKEGLERMKELHPEIYAKYATISESRRFYVKRTEPTAA